MNTTALLLFLAVAIYTLTAAILDWNSRRLPNWLTVSAFVTGLAFHLVTGGWHGLLASLGGFGVGFGILLVLWLIGGSGAGDVKYMGALGAWIGVGMTLYVFVVSALLVAFGGLAWKGIQIARKGFKASRTRHVVPYALPVGLGTWLVLLWKLPVF